MILFAKTWFGRGLSWATIFVSVWVVWNNVVYFDGGPVPRFLLEKGSLVRSPLWISAFYFHVVGASICLLIGLPLMFPALTARYPAWHRRLGYVYVNAVLWLAAPAGLILAASAKGGWWGTIGFALAGACWWVTTWVGYRAILRRDIAAHIRGMIRSYAMALSAPGFRVIQAALYGAGLADATNYIVSLWLSIAASAWLAEWVIYRRANPSPGSSTATGPHAAFHSTELQLSAGDLV